MEKKMSLIDSSDARGERPAELRASLALRVGSVLRDCLRPDQNQVRFARAQVEAYVTRVAAPLLARRRPQRH